jgi:NADH:ubiquinone oxidoreductase subunit K
LPDLLPITHLLYLASGLVVLGLLGMTLRRAPGRVLLGLVLLLVGAAMVWAIFARAWGSGGGQVMAALLVGFTAVYAVLGAALLRGRV